MDFLFDRDVLLTKRIGRPASFKRAIASIAPGIAFAIIKDASNIQKPTANYRSRMDTGNETGLPETVLTFTVSRSY